MTDPIKVLIVDDHLIVREGITSILEIVNDIEVVGEASNAEEALEQIEKLAPNVILVDLRMPGTDGIKLTKLIRTRYPACKVIILTLFDQYISEAINAGAKGYILKDINLEGLVDAIKRVHAGEQVFDKNLQHTIAIEYEDNSTDEIQGGPGGKEDDLDSTSVHLFNQLRVFILPPASISGSLSLTSIVEEAISGEFKQVEGTVSDGFAITFDLYKPLTIKELNVKVSNIPNIEIPGEEELLEDPDSHDLVEKQQSFILKHPLVKTIFVRLL
ncbi:MAG: response regulator transcription factor [Dehalococcoidia bacterium]